MILVEKTFEEKKIVSVLLPPLSGSLWLHVSFLNCFTHTTDVYCFIFRLDVGDAKVAISTRAGSREAIRDPITCAVVSIFLKLHHILRRLEWLLLIPFNGVRTVLTTQGAREFC